MILRPYQQEAINSINEMKEGNKKICYMATGAGKTIIMADIVSNCKGRVLIVVDQRELREQTTDKLLKYLSCNIDEIGNVQANLNEIDKRVIIATRQTLTYPKSRRIEEMISYGNFDYILFDECHRGVEQIKSILNRIPHNSTKIIGFSATPFNLELTKVFDGFVYEKDCLSLIQEKYLCDIKYLKLDTSIDLNGVKTKMGEFVQKDLADKVNIKYRNQAIVNSYIDYASNRKHTIVYCVDIQHSIDVANTFKENGISCESLTSLEDKTDREKILKDFKEGKIEVLTNCAILTTGFDFEELDCIIQACPTKSKIKYVQCLGRGLRVAEGKENVLVLDVVDNVNRHSLQNMETIFDIKNDETVLESIENRKREKAEKIEAERKAREDAELQRQEEERLRLKEIELLNKDLGNLKQFATLDWFATEALDIKTFVLFGGFKKRYYLYKKDEQYILVMNDNDEITFINNGTNLKDLVEETEELAMNCNTNYCYKGAKWKQKKVSDKQLWVLSTIYKFDTTYVKTNWDAMKMFERVELEKYFINEDKLMGSDKCE